MKNVHLEPKTFGFHGVYWKNKDQNNVAIIAMLGDDSEDYLAKSGVRWMQKYGLNVLTMSPDKKDYGHHNYPLERIENAILYLKDRGNNKIGILGASTTGTAALTAASYFPDITLTVALTPSDFIWQGFMQGKRDGCREWPVEGESLFTYHNKPLPYMPFVYQHPDYWHVVEEETKKHGDMINSKKLFDDSEKAFPLTEDQMIKVENIKGILLLIGAEDDALWDTAKYIHRMETRLESKEHECKVEAFVYKHGTHFIYPESFVKTLLPIFPDFIIKLFFSASKKYPKECKETRIDIDRRCKNVIDEWINKDY